jgi:glutaredoxin
MVYLVYTVDDCKYCEMAKDLLKLDDKVNINVTKMMKNYIQRDEFIKKINAQVGYRLIDDKIYFPIIFLDNIYIGGYDELQKHFDMKEYYIFETDCDF